MSTIEAKEIIRHYRSHGVKVTLYQGQPCFSSLEGVSGEDKLKLVKLGRAMQALLLEEQARRKNRVNTANTPTEEL